MAEMTTIKALAQEQHCSYQAIWKLVTKYEKDLGNHVVKKGRDRFLDEFAVNFILEKRVNHPMVAMNVDQSAIIESQKQEIEQLRDKIEALLNEINRNEKQIAELMEDGQKLLEAKIRNEYLLEDNKRIQSELTASKENCERFRNDLETLRTSTATAEAENALLKQTTESQREELTHTRTELDSFQRSIFGLYRKKKK